MKEAKLGKWAGLQRSGRARVVSGQGGPRPKKVYLIQSGHEKQDEDEDVKGRDHQQEERHGCDGSLGVGQL